MDSFQGCYKNGTNPGTTDCRWLPAVIIMARLIVLLMNGCLMNAAIFSFTATLLVILALLVIAIDPFKTQLNSSSPILAIYMLFSATFHVCAAWFEIITFNGTIEAIKILFSITVLVTVLPILYICGLIAFWIVSRKFAVQCIKLMCFKTRIY